MQTPAVSLVLRLALLALCLVLGLPVAVLANRIDPPRVLRTPLRREIFEHVRTRPGITATQLAGLAGVDRKTVTHHTRILQAVKLVDAQRDGRAVRFFLPGTTLPIEFASGIAADILRALLDRPHRSQTEMADDLGVSRATVQWHLRKLSDRGFLVPGTTRVPRQHRDALEVVLGPGVRRAS